MNKLLQNQQTGSPMPSASAASTTFFNGGRSGSTFGQAAPVISPSVQSPINPSLSGGVSFRNTGMNTANSTPSINQSNQMNNTNANNSNSTQPVSNVGQQPQASATYTSEDITQVNNQVGNRGLVSSTKSLPTSNSIKSTSDGEDFDLDKSDAVAADMIEEIELIQKKIDESNVPDDLRDKLDRMVTRLRRMAKFGSYSGEFEVINKYVEWTTGIPWGVVSRDNVDLKQAKEIMDGNHYGMNSVKDLILDYLAVMKLHLDKGVGTPTGPTGIIGSGDEEAKDMKKLEGSSSHAPIICFLGLQGVGKTTMAKSIAQSLGREFIRISLGALGSVTQIRGQSRAHLDAEPGQLIKALVRVGTMNPVILLDEIDKASGKDGLLADVMAALLEILDPQQNSTFVDHYIDYPVDLSNVMFVCTANNLGTLSAALIDRLEVIRFTSYSDEEKVVIAKRYLFPSVLKATALKPDQIIMGDDVWPLVVRPLGFDAGIRQLERNLTTLARHAARLIVEQGIEQITVTRDNIKQFMPEGIGTLS